MSRYFQSVIICFLFCINFVVSGYLEKWNDAAVPQSAVKSFKRVFVETKLKLSGDDDPLTECDCGELGNCRFEEGKKVCTCFSRAAEWNGKCEECDCGLGDCRFSKEGAKTCRCIRKAAFNNGTCEKCDCGQGKCSFMEGQKTCACPLKFTEFNETCVECDCGEGICSFIKSQKTCDCPLKFNELNGTCVECDCGEGNCSFIESQKTCDCPLKFTELNETCVECDCGEGNCSFIESQKTCNCPLKFKELNGTCVECDCGEGNCSFIESQKTCDCSLKFSELNGTCVVCDCGNGKCSFSGDQKTCDCPPNFIEIDGKCEANSECLKMHLNGDCLNPHEICREGKCSCESDYKYTESNETCVRENACTDEAAKKACSDLSSICVENSTNEKDFKCICEKGYVKDKSGKGKCIHKCEFEVENKKCLNILGVCDLDKDYKTTCNCPPIHMKGQTKKCDQMAEHSFVGVFEILKKPYEVFYSKDVIKSSIDYFKLARDINESFTSVYKHYQGSQILKCKEQSADLDCAVELQLTQQPYEELNVIFTPSVCIPMRNSKYCLLPPRLILNRNGNMFKKTDPCDEVIANRLCGPTTACQLLEDRKGFHCKCKPGFVSTGAYEPFPGDTESVIQKCNDIDECLVETACPESSYCVNRIGSYDCFCKDGFHPTNKMDVKLEGCADICNPNPCVHGTCNITGSDGFICNCEPSYTGFTCNEPNLLISDIEQTYRKYSFVIGGTLGALLVIAAIVCISLIRKIQKKSMGEEEDRTFEIHRKRWVQSRLALDGARSNEENVENTARDLNIYRNAEIDTTLYAYPKDENGEAITFEEEGESSRQQHRGTSTSKSAAEHADDRRKRSYQQHSGRGQRQDQSKKNRKGSKQRVYDQDHTAAHQNDVRRPDTQKIPDTQEQDERKLSAIIHENKAYEDASNNENQRRQLSTSIEQMRDNKKRSSNVLHKHKVYEEDEIML